MALFEVQPFLFFGLKDKVVVLTGGARGIGAATVSLLHEHGAYVVFGDQDALTGKWLASSFSDGRVHFLPMNVTSYADNVALYGLALEKYGTVDHAFAIAGIAEQSNWFHHSLDIDSVETCPDPVVLNINLLVVLHFSRIAAVYLRHGTLAQGPVEKTLVLVSSVAGFMEAPGLGLYGASKHGVIGLMRSLRCTLPASHQINVCAICPWMTATAMVRETQSQWIHAGLPMNQVGT